MEAENICEKICRVPVFPLNLDCVFEVFKRLENDDCMNLAEAYDGVQSVADWIYKWKFNDVDILYDESNDMDRIR